MKTSTLTLALSNGSAGSKTNLSLYHPNSGRQFTVIASDTAPKSFSAIRKGDAIYPSNGTTGDCPPVNIAGVVTLNDVARTFTVMDAEGGVVATASVAAGGGSFSFSDAPAGWYLVVG